MESIIINLWFLIIFIPGIYFIYKNMQCIDFEKILKKGKVKEFKVIYLFLSIALSFIVSMAFITVLQKIYDIVNGIISL